MFGWVKKKELEEVAHSVKQLEGLCNVTCMELGVVKDAFYNLEKRIDAFEKEQSTVNALKKELEDTRTSLMVQLQEQKAIVDYTLLEKEKLQKQLDEMACNPVAENLSAQLSDFINEDPQVVVVEMPKRKKNDGRPNGAADDQRDQTPAQTDK